MMRWAHHPSRCEVALFSILSPLTVSEGTPGGGRVYQDTPEQKAGRVSLGSQRDGDWHTTSAGMAGSGCKPSVLRARCCQCRPLAWQEFCIFFPRWGNFKCAKGVLKFRQARAWGDKRGGESRCLLPLSPPGLKSCRLHENKNPNSMTFTAYINMIFFFCFAIWPICVSFEKMENLKVISRSIYSREATVLNDSSLNIY